ncbi:membrane protein [Staphylococcus microti]|uniref:Membrane protein n=1 Tax=Staphylococcus microti TaxID=569857 RepID=A0ABR5C9F1_9STAP|nr:membrane protein [Staphylococcus microti]
MLKKEIAYLKWLKVLSMGLFVGTIVCLPILYRYLAHGIVYSGSGDGFKQMMVFQLFIYERMTNFSSFYDLSLGLGGDYFTDLAYYYTTSPIMYINFLGIKLMQTFGHIDPSAIDFWPDNQIIVAYMRCVLTFLVTYGMFKAFKIENPYRFVGAMLYSTSTVLYYFNFAMSFYGDVLIYLPLSIWGMERFFKTRKIGLFIFAIALTLFSNFYLSYYEAIALTIYLIYRMIDTHPKDIVSRWKKLWLLCPAVLMSLCIASFGFLTGVQSFLSNDRQLGHYHVPKLISFNQNYHIFSSGFFITITFIALVALFSFKLYRHYYYRLFAILTWILLLGSLTPYMDSFFNGFSFPARRWSYLLALSTSVLIAAWLKYFTELTWRDYLISLIPLVPLAIATVMFSAGRMWWMVASALILCIVAYYLYHQKNLSKRMMYIIVGLFIVQQFVMLLNYRTNYILEYEADMKSVQNPKYYSHVLQEKIDEITKKQSPLDRIDYMELFSINSSMIYHYNGVALYSSIFDKEILDYYENQMQINMEFDSNSTYRMLGNRANIYALWGVTDRIKRGEDTTIPYGMVHEDTIKDQDATWSHSRNRIDYPAAHLTSKVYDDKDLKSPLDREHAFLQGVVMEGIKGNTSFESNPNLVKSAKITPRDATQKGDELTVSKDLGGLDIAMPKDSLSQHKDYYVEMDVELLHPSQVHYLKLDDFHQKRTELTYRYRRFVTPVTVRVPANEPIKLKLKKGTYRVNIKGIYGEDYSTLEKAKDDVIPVKVTKTKRDIRVKMNPTKKSYLVMPMPYRDGLKAEVDGEVRDVKKGNGLQTVIPVNKGEKNVVIYYELPHWRIYLVMTIVGLISAFVYRKWLRRSI